LVEKAAPAPAASADEDDDMMGYFQKIANEK